MHILFLRADDRIATKETSLEANMNAIFRTRFPKIERLCIVTMDLRQIYSIQ